MQPLKTYTRGFTLIELSIVLVIIGLIVGGVLVGRDLISAAAVRAQISQIEKYQTAVNTFRGKYGYLPGDIPEPEVSKFGFFPRGDQASGNSNGDGLVHGILEYAGEQIAFWMDLSTANLIQGGFTGDAASSHGRSYPMTTVTGKDVGKYFPEASLGGTMYVYAYSNGYVRKSGENDGTNYFGLAGIDRLRAYNESSYLYSYDRMKVSQAYTIDQKIDDGLPQHGKVLAGYLQAGLFVWAGHDWFDTGIQVSGPATPRDDLSYYAGDSTSCYHNTTNVVGPMHYAIDTNPNYANCALSFKFQ